MSVLKMLGLGPSKSDEKLKELVSRSYQSVRVVGRGTIKIDPQEVRKTEQFIRAREQAKAIVSRD